MPQVLLEEEHVAPVQEKQGGVGMAEQLGVEPPNARGIGASRLTTDRTESGLIG